jgi:hypothetical protein
MDRSKWAELLMPLPQDKVTKQREAVDYALTESLGFWSGDGS